MIPSLDILLSIPLFGVTVTVTAYALSVGVHNRCGKPAFLHPVLTATAAVAMLLIATGQSYEAYFAQAFPLHVALGVVVVLLAVPLYRQFNLIREGAGAIAITLLLGSVVAIASALAYPLTVDAPASLHATIAPKSATTAVAVQISEGLGGITALTAIVVISTGIFGAAFGPSILRTAGVTDDRAVGLALGIASHAIGTARAPDFRSRRCLRIARNDPECRPDDPARPGFSAYSVKAEAGGTTEFAKATEAETASRTLPVAFRASTQFFKKTVSFKRKHQSSASSNCRGSHHQTREKTPRSTKRINIASFR